MRPGGGGGGAARDRCRLELLPTAGDGPEEEV